MHVVHLKTSMIPFFLYSHVGYYPWMPSGVGMCTCAKRGCIVMLRIATSYDFCW